MSRHIIDPRETPDLLGGGAYDPDLAPSKVLSEEAALPGHPSPDRGSGPWLLRLVCCGYDDGTERYDTWDEADAFRQSYITGPGGHDRAAILSRTMLDTSYHRRRVARREAPSGEAALPVTDQGRWLLDHQGLINIGRVHGSMRGDEIDLRASIVTIEAEAAIRAEAGTLDEAQALVTLHEDHYRRCPGPGHTFPDACPVWAEYARLHGG